METELKEIITAMEPLSVESVAYRGAENIEGVKAVRERQERATLRRALMERHASEEGTREFTVRETIRHVKCDAGICRFSEIYDSSFTDAEHVHRFAEWQEL